MPLLHKALLVSGSAKNLAVMVYHILNGDSLAYSFPEAKIEGEIMVVREALIDGEFSGDNLPGFWQSRAKYMKITETEYNHFVV
jgi:hypothetical protein